MKVMIKVLSVTLALFMANSVFANAVNPGFMVEVSEDKTINFKAKHRLSSAFEITFQDKEGTVIFSEYSVSPLTFERNYNLSELADGEYFLLIKDDLKTQTLPLFIKGDDLQIDLEKLETIPYTVAR